MSEIFSPILKSIRKQSAFSIIIKDQGDGFLIELATGSDRREIASIEADDEALRRAVSEVRKSEQALKRAPIAFELSEQEVISTDYLRPIQAMGRIEKLAALDLERTTPLKLEEVYIATEQRERRGNAVETTDHVAKRARIKDLQALFERSGLIGVEVRPKDRRVNFLKSVEPSSFKIGQLGQSLIAGAVAVSLILGALYYRQSDTISRLDREIAGEMEIAKSAAGQEFGIAAKATAYAHLQTVRADMTSSVEAWETISLALPDGAWLTGMEVTGAEVTIEGYSQNAARLVGLLQGHSKIGSATLTAPITLDARQGLERFSIALQIETQREGT